jgi:hypothetical protein
MVCDFILLHCPLEEHLPQEQHWLPPYPAVLINIKAGNEALEDTSTWDNIGFLSLSTVMKIIINETIDSIMIWNRSWPSLVP